MEPIQYLQHDVLEATDSKYIPIIKMPVKGHEEAFRKPMED